MRWGARASNERAPKRGAPVCKKNRQEQIQEDTKAIAPMENAVGRKKSALTRKSGRQRRIPGKLSATQCRRLPRTVDYRYVDELVRLQFELPKIQGWVRLQVLKVCALFEGRDAAGRG